MTDGSSPLAIAGRLVRWGAALAVLGMAGCARPVVPGGGPEDLVPPRLVSSFPESGAVDVSPRATLRLRFTEWIDPSTAKASAVLVPIGARQPEIKVDGPELLVIPREPLDSPATYVLRLQPGLADWRKAATRAAIEIPFSTGSRIDSGNFAAKVWTGSDTTAPGVAKARLGAWPLDSAIRSRLSKLLRRKDSTRWLAESPLPWREKPWRWTWTDSAGLADLRFLPPGRWRLFAWDDKDKDNFWRPGVEAASWIGDLDGTAGDWQAEVLVRLGSLDTLGAPPWVRDSTKDSLVRKDSLALDSLAARWDSLAVDSSGVVVVASDSLPASWKGANVRLKVWPTFRRARPRTSAAALSPELRLAPGRWSGEIWQDLDGDGKVGVGDLQRGRAMEPWCAVPPFEIEKGDSLRVRPDCRIRIRVPTDTTNPKRENP
jgi:hypothetical protein